jgi:hypothetical protein
LDEGSSWPFVGYNMTGFSIYDMMNENMFNSLLYVVEEIVTLQGGNFLSSNMMDDDILVVADKNLITGMNDNSLNMCLNNLFAKIN